MWFDQIWLTVTKQTTNCHQILIQMLLNPDWCTEVDKHHVTSCFFSPSHAHIKPVKTAQAEISHVK